MGDDLKADASRDRALADELYRRALDATLPAPPERAEATRATPRSIEDAALHETSRVELCASAFANPWLAPSPSTCRPPEAPRPAPTPGASPPPASPAAQPSDTALPTKVRASQLPKYGSITPERLTSSTSKGGMGLSTVDAARMEAARQIVCERTGVDPFHVVDEATVASIGVDKQAWAARERDAWMNAYEAARSNPLSGASVIGSAARGDTGVEAGQRAEGMETVWGAVASLGFSAATPEVRTELEPLEKMRPRTDAPPPGLREAELVTWEKYCDHYERRVAELHEGNVRPSGEKLPPEPMKWEAYRGQFGPRAGVTLHSSRSMATSINSPAALRATDATVVRPVDLHADHPVARWLAPFARKLTPTNDAKGAFEVRHTGPENIRVSGGGTQIWTDGVAVEQADLLDAKFVQRPDRSPFIEGSACPAFVRDKVLAAVTEEFSRYARVIQDPTTPVTGLQVIVNDSRAVPFFTDLMGTLKVPGTVVVKP